MSRSHSAHQSSKPHNVAAATGRQLQLLHILATAAVETEAEGALAEGPEAEGAAWANCAACKEASQHVHQSSNPHNPLEAAIGWQWQLLHIGCRASEAEGAAMVELAVSPSASISLNNATMRWQPHQHIDIARLQGHHATTNAKTTPGTPLAAVTQLDRNNARHHIASAPQPQNPAKKNRCRREAGSPRCGRVDAALMPRCRCPHAVSKT